MHFTLDDLATTVRTAAGGLDDLEPITESNVGVEFAELGYDSLVMLEFVGHLKRSHGLELPDDAIDSLRTPREALASINGQLDQRAVA